MPLLKRALNVITEIKSIGTSKSNRFDIKNRHYEIA